MALIRIAGLDEVPPGKSLAVQADGTPVVVCNQDGTLHAFRDSCPHRNGPLSQGNFIDGRLICPWHAWEFEVESGRYDYNPSVCLERYAVSVAGGEVFVEIE